jgi:hypothetical protein
MYRDHAHERATTTPGPCDPAHQPWIDRLVELHVLADNGDLAAAAAAASWIAEDTEARRVWEDVQRVCDQVQNRRPGD